MPTRTFPEFLLMQRIGDAVEQFDAEQDAKVLRVRELVGILLRAPPCKANETSIHLGLQMQFLGKTCLQRAINSLLRELAVHRDMAAFPQRRLAIGCGLLVSCVSS